MRNFNRIQKYNVHKKRYYSLVVNTFNIKKKFKYQNRETSVKERKNNLENGKN
jgi:hypothetical protein